MNIDRITTYECKAELDAGERFYSSQGFFQERTSLVIRIDTDDGLTGWGESGVSMPVAHLATYIHEVLAPRVLGRDASETGPIWQDLYTFSRDFGRKGACVDAMSGIDTALWDIKGKAAGKPIHALMGGAFRKRVRAYATGLYYREGDLDDPAGAAERGAEEANAHIGAGFSMLKAKIGLLALKDDIRRLEAVRDAVGPDVILMADANHAYNRVNARHMADALARLECYWFEEPLVPEDIAGMAELRRQVTVPIAAGECEYTRFGMHELLRADAVDLLQPDISACGGLTEVQRIVSLAETYNTPVCFHVWGSGIAVAAALQATACIPPIPQTARPRAPENEPLFEYDRTANPLRDDLTSCAFGLEGDMMPIPGGPGLGVEIDEVVLERFTVRQQETKAS